VADLMLTSVIVVPRVRHVTARTTLMSTVRKAPGTLCCSDLACMAPATRG
jgi:hypothetical protein